MTSHENRSILKGHIKGKHTYSPVSLNRTVCKNFVNFVIWFYIPISSPIVGNFIIGNTSIRCNVVADFTLIRIRRGTSCNNFCAVCNVLWCIVSSPIVTNLFGFNFFYKRPSKFKDTGEKSPTNRQIISIENMSSLKLIV